MNSRIVLVVSLAFNLICVVGLLWRGRPPETNPAPGPQTVPTTVVAEPGAEPAAPRFHWSQLESTNYFAYIANLREIGCPEQTIRDIISADLSAVLCRPPAAGSTGTGETDAPQEGVLTKHLLPVQTEPPPGRSAPGTPPRLAAETVAAAPDTSKTDVTYYAGLLTEHVLNPRQAPLPVSSVEADPGQPSAEPSIPSSDGTADEEQGAASLESRRRKRFESLQRIWVVDRVRARYGIDALLGWQQQAVREGVPFEEFVQHHQIPIPSLGFQP
jgi:hypothetical protein